MTKNSSSIVVLNLIKQYWKTIIWLYVILFLSTIQVSQLPKASLFTIPHFDKMVHFTLYFILASVWLIDDFKKRLEFNKKILFLIVLSSVAYGVIMEIVQKVIVQNRDGDFFDALANAMGVAIAFLLFRYYEFYRNTLKKFL